MYYPDKPKSQGVANGLKRALQMTEFEWTPLRPVPGVIYYYDREMNKKYLEYFIQAGLPQKGVIYSSARIVDKHIGFEVPLETYATALKNPDSVLYTRCLHGTSGHGVGCWYGIVCSAFASYVHNMPWQVVCAEWASYPGISRLDITKPEDLDSLELLDIVLNPKTHVAVVTGIERDTEGKVHRVEVSESTLPTCRRLWYTPEEFKTYWFDRGFSVFRNAAVDGIPYTPCPYSPVEGDEELLDANGFEALQTAKRPRGFMSDYGNKANYALGEPVVFSVPDSAIREITVRSERGETVSVPVEEGRAEFTPDAAGVWRAFAVKSEGCEESVEWYVFDFRVRLDKEIYTAGEPIEVTFTDAQNQDKIFRYYLKTRDRYKKLARPVSPEEISAGRLTIPGTLDPGTYYVSVYTRGPYASYGSLEVKLEVTE